MNSKSQAGEVRSGVSAERRRLLETIQRRSAAPPLRRIIIEVKP
jgi:hypothetical protein